MMDAEREILRKLVALDVFDQYVFPHEQLQRDVTRMQLAIDALESGNPALANETYVRRTGLTDAGRLFAYESYAAAAGPARPWIPTGSSGAARRTWRPTSTCGRSTTPSPRSW